VSVFHEDDEAFTLWRDKIGFPAARIKRLGEDDNFGYLVPLALVVPVQKYITTFTQN
jgi:hypothetical protein